LGGLGDELVGGPKGGYVDCSLIALWSYTHGRLGGETGHPRDRE
jgi:hypothetical protein